MAAGFAAHPMVALTGAAVALAGAAMAAVVMTRGDGARQQQAALTAATTAALRTPAGFERWVARAGGEAFERPADGSVRHLYQASAAGERRWVAVDVTLTDGRALCLVSTRAEIGVRHEWRQKPCRDVMSQPAPAPGSPPSGR